MITLYGDIISGNCYKAYLVASLLNIDIQWKNIDIMKGDAATEEFKAKNPNAKVPLMKLEDGRLLAESNAIINYLAEGSELIPSDPYQKAKVFEWQFFEQYSHEPFIAVARFINKYQGLPEERLEEYNSKQAGGHKALSIMECQLEKSNFLVGDSLTVADISLYAYTHVAHEGGFSLQGYPAIEAWIKRIEALPNYVGMELKSIHR